MLIIRTYCIYFSIRLGALVIGIGYLIESAVMLVMSGIWMGMDPSSTSSALKDILADYELLYVSDILHRISKDPSPFRELSLAISCCRVLNCVCVIYGSYYMKPFYLLPFLFLEAIRMGFCTFLHITWMQIIKKNNPSLGILIVLTLFGSFLLCFILYNWICVYSLYKVLRRISSKVVHPKAPLILEESISSSSEFPPRLYPAYSVNSYNTFLAPVY